MAGERALPGLGLSAYWTVGSDGWDVKHDPDIRIVSAVVQLNVISRLAAVPGSPTNGDIHILTSAPNLNAVAVRDNGAWVYLTPTEGWIGYDKATDEYITFNGTVWTTLLKNTAKGIFLSTKTVAYTLVDADLAGGGYLVVDMATANNLTVPPGLAVGQPVSVFQKGAGQITFTPGSGVSFLSADNKYKTRVQNSVASLIPLSSNVYMLVGDLAA